MTKFRFDLTQVVLSAALSVCFGVGLGNAQPKESIKIGGYFPPTFETTYERYAIDGGFLAKEGLDAKFVGFTAGLTSVQAATSGSVDIACESPVTAIMAIRQGAELRILSIVNAESSYAIVARDTIKSAADLRGKKWGISQVGSISQTYGSLWLSGNKMSDKDIQFVPIGGQSARARALSANQIDVTLVSAGDWLKLDGQPGVRLLGYLTDVVPPLPFDSCFVTKQTLETRPGMIQKFVNGVMNGVRHARTAEGKRGYLESFKADNANAFTDPQLDRLYNIYFNESPTAIDPNGGMYPELMQRTMQTLVDDKTLDALLPLERVWAPQFLAKYIAENGWYDTKTNTSGHAFRDLLMKK